MERLDRDPRLHLRFPLGRRTGIQLTEGGVMFRAGDSPTSKRRSVRQEVEQSGQIGIQWGTLFLEFRKGKKLDRESVARALKIDWDRLAKFEQNNTIPQLRTRLKFVVYLNTFIEDTETLEIKAIKEEFKKVVELGRRIKREEEQELKPSQANENDSNLGESIDRLKKETGLSIRALAGIIGISHNGVYLLISGKNQPQQSTRDSLREWAQKYSDNKDARDILSILDTIDALPKQGTKKIKIPQRLEHLRKKHNLSQTDLAAVLGISDEAMERVMAGKLRLDYDILNGFERLPVFSPNKGDKT